ncbi:MAG TPA: hypothetical protein VGC22_13675 [Chitinophaga sp.]
MQPVFKYPTAAGLLLAFFFAACHAPGVHDASRFNDAASLAAGDKLPADPLQWRVLNVFTDTRTHTQATLYANDTAYTFARSQGGGAYPPHARLALVTWVQQDDPHWLGALMAGNLKSVELITFENGAPPAYARYEGRPLTAAGSTSGDSARLAYVLQQPVLSFP